MNIGNLNFEAEEYWRTIEQALRDESAVVMSQDATIKYTFQRMDESEDRKDKVESPGVYVLDADGKQIQEIRDPSFGLLVPGEAVRRANIQQLRAWFDCDRKEFDVVANDLVSNDDSARRMLRFNEWRMRSTELHYHALEQRLRRGETVSWSETLPNFESFRRRMRLPAVLSGTRFTIGWESFAHALLKEDDLVGSLAR